MSRHAPAGLAGLIGGIFLAATGIIAVAGNGGKYLAQYSHNHSAHPSPLVSAEASGAAPSRPYAPLATYSGEE